MSEENEDRLQFFALVTRVIEGIEGVEAILPDADQMTLGVRRRGFEEVFLSVAPLYQELSSVPREQHGELLAQALLSGLQQMERRAEPEEGEEGEDGERPLQSLSVLPAWEQASPNIFPVLGPPIFHETGLVGLLRVEFLPLVHVYLAHDEPEQFRLLSPADSARLQKTTNALVEAALSNLGKLHHRFEPFDEELPFPNFQLHAEDAYASSRLCLPGLLPMMMEHVGGAAVAAVPDRNTLLVTGTADEALGFLIETAERLWLEAEHKVSPMLYCVDKEGHLAPLEVAADHPLADALARIRTLFVASVYEEQGKALRALAEQQGEDVAIAEATAIEHPELGIVTVTPFAKGAPALLPLTDLVFLSWAVEEQLHHLMLRRETLSEVCPQSLIELADHDPPRLLAASFPSAEALEKLRAAAISSGSRPLEAEEPG